MGREGKEGMDRVEKHITRAVGAAKLSTQRYRHGAVIAHGGKVMSVGINTRRSHPSVCTDPQTESAFHAEVSAIRGLRTTTKPHKMVLFSARVDALGFPQWAKPCFRCRVAMRNAGCTECYFTTGYVDSPYQGLPL